MLSYRIVQDWDDSFYLKRKNFLGLWVNVTEERCHVGGCWTETCYFSTQKEAAEYMVKSIIEAVAAYRLKLLRQSKKPVILSFHDAHLHALHDVADEEIRNIYMKAAGFDPAAEPAETPAA